MTDWTRRGSRAAWWTAAGLTIAISAGAQEQLPPTDGGAPDAGSDAAPAPAPAPRPAPAPAPAPDQTYADSDPSALVDFRATLDAYGYWRQDPAYGLVWIPDPASAGADFAPYVSSGHWALDAAGDWLWVSDYPWGWVAFHYGRWAWITGVGWAWIPGRRYANAWVVWRVGEPGWDYVGWAPLPPAFIWVGGSAVVLGFYPPYPFVFCEARWAFGWSVHRHLVPQARLRAVAGHTRRWHVPTTSARVGPPPQLARVPARAVPRTRAAPDPRAVAASRPRATASHAPARPATPATRSRTPARAATPATRSRTPARSATPAPPRRTPAPAARPAPRAPATPRRAPPAPYYSVPRAAPPRAAPRKPPPKKATPPKRAPARSRRR